MMYLHIPNRPLPSLTHSLSLRYARLSQLLVLCSLSCAAPGVAVAQQNTEAASPPAAVPAVSPASPSDKALPVAPEKKDDKKVDPKESSSADIVVSNAILKTLESTTVAARTAGVINSLVAKEGLTVKPGQELGRIRDSAVKLQIDRAKAALDVAQTKQKDNIDERLAQKSLDVSDNEYQRALQSNQRVPGSYTINEVDRLKLVVDRCRLEVERAVHMRHMASLESNIAETEYRQALEMEERHHIQAPVSGVVVSVEKHVGEWVEPGAALMKIERIDRLRVEGFVSATDAMRKIVGQPATVTCSLPTGTIETHGKVVFVSPSIDPILSTARVFIEIENKDALFRPGLGVHARIKLP